MKPKPIEICQLLLIKAEFNLKCFHVNATTWWKIQVFSFVYFIGQVYSHELIQVLFSFPRKMFENIWSLRIPKVVMKSAEMSALSSFFLRAKVSVAYLLKLPEIIWLCKFAREYKIVEKRKRGKGNKEGEKAIWREKEREERRWLGEQT